MTTGGEHARLRQAALHWRALSSASVPSRPTEWLDDVRRSLEGWASRRLPLRRRLLREAAWIDERAGACRSLGDHELDDALAAACERARLGRVSQEDETAAWALVVEAADRALGQRPYPVQIAGALALQRGCAVEMATGEGKTLATGLAAVVAGWRGRGCHVVTVNDYLAARDRDWMAPLHERCGVSSASVTQESDQQARLGAYSADVTYLTSKEAAADYLRDTLALGRRGSLASYLLRDESGLWQARIVMRGLTQAIVDEADSVLLDEATTPLMISAESPGGAPEAAVRRAAALARELEPPGDYTLGERERQIRLTRAGRERVMGQRVEGLSARRWEECVVEALSALRFFHRGAHYIVEDGKAVIVDEATGRLTPDRSWRHGFHRVVEAKEGLELTASKETLARISFQRFFRLYERLSGLSGTLRENADELWSVYGLRTVSLPTHRACVRVEEPDCLLRSGGERDEAGVRAVVDMHASGRPVLVGVRRISDAERVSELLGERGVTHRVLTATNHREEAEIIGEAGRAGAVTVATNMAGRGTDIRLDDSAREAGGLCVVAFERQDSRRLDRQLFGRCGRQGDPGRAVAFGSLDDELIRRFGGLWGWVLRGARIGGAGGLYRFLWAFAQRRAARSAKSARRSVLRHDDWLDDALAFSQD